MKKINPQIQTPTLSYQALTIESWVQFEKLFGDKGACGGCWCMWWRLKRSEYEASKGEGNKNLMKALVGAGDTLGLMAIHQNNPIGWCALSPRSSFPVLDRSRVLKKVDDQLVWSLPCLFIIKDFRNQGISSALVNEAVKYCFNQGAKIVEAYPVQPKKDRMPDVFAWTGLYSTFVKAGFKEVARRSETRPIMRKYAGH